MTDITVTQSSTQSTNLFKNIFEAGAFLKEAAEKGINKEITLGRDYLTTWWQEKDTQDDKTNAKTNAEKWGEAYAMVMKQRNGDLYKASGDGMTNLTKDEEDHWLKMTNLSDPESILHIFGKNQPIDFLVAQVFYWVTPEQARVIEEKNEIINRHKSNILREPVERWWKERNGTEELEVLNREITSLPHSFTFSMKENVCLWTLLTVEMAGYIGGTVMPEGRTSWGATIPSTTTAS